MKLLSKFSFLALALAIGFTSCKKDSDGNGSSNAASEMTIKGTSSTIGSGVIIDNGTIDNGNFNFDLELFAEGLTFHSEEDSLSGTGNVLYFEMFTSDSTGLDAGTYVFNQTTGDKTLDIASAIVNFDSELEESDEHISATSGSVTIDKDGNTYIIDIEFTDGDGNNVTAHYEGTLYLSVG
jgi:hypothetical protein